MYHFVRRTSVVPALLVTLPLALADLAWLDAHDHGWGPLFGIAFLGTLTLVLATLARDAGKTRESHLLRLWGGKPVIRRLRHRDAPPGSPLAAQHRQLEKTILGLHMPTASEEQADPDAAEAIYRRVASFLQERGRIHGSAARDSLERYRLRRTLFGFKPIGIVTASLGAAAAFGLIVTTRVSRDAHPVALAVTVALLNVGLALGWSLLVTPDWVKISAEEYAERLLAICDQI